MRIQDSSSSETWIPSQYNIDVSLPGKKKAVANLFTAEIITVNLDEWELFLKPGSRYRVPDQGISPSLQRLFDQGFLVSESTDEQECVKLFFQNIRFLDNDKRILIAPTMACNLRCPYCFEEGVRKTKKLRAMSPETEKAVITFILELCEEKNSLCVNWFGGEPLLRVDSIGRISDHLMRALEHKNIPYYAQITTNGVLLEKDIVDKLHDWNVKDCQITVDIPTSYKQDARGRSVLEKQLDNMVYAAEKLDVQLRVNVSQDDEDEFDSLYSSLIQRGLHKSLHCFVLAMILPAECSRADCQILPLGRKDFFKVGQRERLKAKELGFPIEDWLPGANGPCGATRVAYTLIGPDGALYKCPNDLGIADRSHASVFPDRPVKLQNLIPWLTYDWFKYDECRKCQFLPRCAAGCPHRRRYGYGSNDLCRTVDEQLKEEIPKILSARALKKQHQNSA